METIGAMPNGFVTGSGLYDLDTGRFAPVTAKTVSVSHLSRDVRPGGDLRRADRPGRPAGVRAARGCSTAGSTTRAGPSRRRSAARHFGNLILRQGHSRLTAYAATRLDNDDLAARAWKEFYTGDGYAPNLPWASQPVTKTLNPTQAANWVSTNTTALYGLAAIQTLALVGDQIVNP